MTDRKDSSNNNSSSSSGSQQKATQDYAFKRGGYSPLAGQLLPVAPSTSTGESGSATHAAPQPVPLVPASVNLQVKKAED
jgi:hypothetical protein